MRYAFRPSNGKMFMFYMYCICVFADTAITKLTFHLLWECIEQDDSTADTYVCEITHKHNRMVTFTLCESGSPPEAPAQRLVIRNWSKAYALVNRCVDVEVITLFPKDMVDCMIVPSIVSDCVSYTKFRNDDELCYV